MFDTSGSVESNVQTLPVVDCGEEVEAMAAV